MSFPGFLTLIDFEATSKYPHTARATEIGLIALDENLNEVARYATVMRPPVAIDPIAQKIMNLSTEEINATHTFKDYWPDIYPFINNRVLVAHNAEYDLGVLTNELRAIDINANLASLCTLQMAFRTLAGVTKNQKLGTIAEHFGISFDAHQALDDAEVAGKILKEMLARTPAEYMAIGRAIDLVHEIPAPTYLAKPATPRQIRTNPYAGEVLASPKPVESSERVLSDSQIEKLAHDMIAKGRTQVCLTGEPSMGKPQFSRDLEEVGFTYTVGDIRKTKTAFFVIGVRETGLGKIHDAQAFNIPTFTDSDYIALLDQLRAIKGVAPAPKSAKAATIEKILQSDKNIKRAKEVSTPNDDFESFLAGEATDTPEPRLADNDIEDPQALSIPIDLEINADMQKAIDLAQAGKSFFLTGNAGTGKSTILAYLRKYILDENTAVCAPTGVAAINVRGVTIHNFFSFGIDVTFEHVKSEDYFPRNRDAMRALKTLVIDEISMVRADMLDYVDQALRRFGPNKNKPFGGVQVILIGDLAQIAPIVAKQDERDFLNSHYRSEFFFDSYAMQDLDFQTVSLSKIYRQTDIDFIDTLNAVRLNQMEEHHYDFLHELVDEDFIPEKDDFYITLTSTNKKAEEINANKLQELTTKLHRNRAWVNGKFREKDFPTLQDLEFKVGAQIMMVNNDPERRWANGTLARITEINISGNRSDSHIKIVVMGNESNEFEVRPHRWDVLSPGFDGSRLTYEPAGTFSQYPFTLAWAVTIHKSQGKTFDRVILDLSRKVFAPGQLYVALSRCRGSEGLVLHKPVTPDQVITHPRVVEFMNENSA
jgi:DNA polymerase III epsilon subunit-like protein